MSIFNPPPQRPEKDVKELHKDARDHIAKAEALKALITQQPDYAIKTQILGLKLWLCNNEAFVELLDKEIAEAKKALNGEPNKFE